MKRLVNYGMILLLVMASLVVFTPARAAPTALTAVILRSSISILTIQINWHSSCS